MTDALIRDIESYLAGDWDSWDVEATGLLKQCLERLTQREEDSAPATPTLGETMLYVGAAVRTKFTRGDTNVREGLVTAHCSTQLRPWFVTLGHVGGWYNESELELI